MSGLSSSRRGSALLVVLGMLSFMVISGLAFSIYMRATRMPSSFTRRTVATRQLAKAALAEAIDQIDCAIANDPHPNVRIGNANEKNYWLGRILLAPYNGFDEDGNVEKRKAADVAGQIDTESETGSFPETVPVLTLEALAYVPPPLVNEVRFYGQRTPTAAWQTFDFDAGRYAFVALDVSDYFDVNRALATEARSSNPARRVNIAYLFEGGGAEHSSKPSNVANWDGSGGFIDLYTKRDPQDDGTIDFPDSAHPPFLSLADFNLALGSQTYAGMKSPFVQYLKTTDSDGFYNAEPGDGNWDAYSRMTFVTDSLEARDEENESSHFDLDADADQPFPESFFDLGRKQRSVSKILDDYVAQQSYRACYYLSGQNKNANNCVSACGMLALADYLDKDDVPTSLALPTTERVPMVCAVRPMLEGGLKVVVTRKFSDEKTTDEAETERYKQRTVTVAYKLTGEINVDAWTVFPFRDQVGFSGGYAADCRVAAFLSTEKMAFRTVSPVSSDDLLRMPDLTASALKNGVANLFKSKSSCSTSKVATPADAFKQMDGFELGDVSEVFPTEGATVLKVTYRWKQQKDSKTGQWSPEAPASVADCEIVGKPEGDLAPVKADGTEDTQFKKWLDKTKLSDLKPANLHMNLAVWIAVRNGSGDVVDLVPACMSDDVAYNQMEYDEGFNDIFKTVTGERSPLLKFNDRNDSDDGFALMKAEDLLSKSETGETVHEFALSSEKGLVIRDPRYNYAPENWCAASTEITQQNWLQNTGCADAGCDGDIFMATSDQETLQSISEITFLPRFTSLTVRPQNQDCGDWIKNPEEAWTGTDYPTKGSEAQANMMWRTYNPFVDADNRNGFVGTADQEGLNEIFRHRGRGMSVNPYSDSTNVIMAAFANTPVSWRVASDNEDSSVNKLANDQTDVAEFNSQYAWNAYSTAGYKISWADLMDISGEFMGRVRATAVAGGSWETVLTDLFAGHSGDDETKLCGIELEEDGRFYSVDKKTLWGFWQDSFAARQQLFLVFFRAEPLMLGGGIAGETPPQLGAKGVALVWRDPNATSGAANNNNTDNAYVPHRTRVLFYRQFE